MEHCMQLMAKPDAPTLTCAELIKANAIYTRFQPIISMRGRDIVGLEALTYGLNPKTGQRVTPDLLFAWAAQEEITLELDRHCRVRAMSSFKERFIPQNDFLLWLNIETSILTSEVSGDGHLLETARTYGLPPHRIVLEIVESDVSDQRALQDFVDVHRNHGFFIALDDVGAGHSNLERIARLKPDVIKIDRYLIRDVGGEYHKNEVVRSLVNLAQGIGSLVVAEGLENEDEAMAVLDLGVNLHQGFIYAHPDQPWEEQQIRCLEKMDQLAVAFRSRRIDRFTVRQTYFNAIGSMVNDITRSLAQANPERFDEVLNDVLASATDLECLYVLNEDGVQITQTVCEFTKLMRPNSPLFRPAPMGADLSLKDYYLLIKAGLPRYVSDPYISRASGNLCVTVSQRFLGADKKDYILCADYDCEAGFHC